MLGAAFPARQAILCLIPPKAFLTAPMPAVGGYIELLSAALAHDNFRSGLLPLTILPLIFNLSLATTWIAEGLECFMGCFGPLSADLANQALVRYRHAQNYI